MLKLWSRAAIWFRLGFGPIGSLGITVFSWLRSHPGEIWHRYQDAKEAWDLLGGNAPMLMSLVTNPFFGIALIAISLIGIPPATERAKGKNIPAYWGKLGWGMFVCLAILVGSGILFEEYMDSSGESVARRYYVEQHTERHLTDKQKAAVCSGVKDAKKDPFLGWTIASDAAPESVQYATEIYTLLKACGSHPVNVDMQDAVAIGVTMSPKNTGFFVVIEDENHPNIAATLIHDIFTGAGFQVKYFKAFKGGPPSLFVGPR